jgi:hypothetical protein
MFDGLSVSTAFFFPGSFFNISVLFSVSSSLTAIPLELVLLNPIFFEAEAMEKL